MALLGLQQEAKKMAINMQPQNNRSINKHANKQKVKVNTQAKYFSNVNKLYVKVQKLS